MIKPISHYDKKKAKGRSKKPEEHIVYVVRPVGDNWHKIGRTKNMGVRLTTYETNSGRDFEVRFQFVVGSADDAKALERAFIVALREKYEGRRKEWFLLLDRDLVAEIVEMHRSSPVEILQTRGDVTATLPAFCAHSETARAAAMLNHSRLPSRFH